MADHTAELAAALAAAITAAQKAGLPLDIRVGQPSPSQQVAEAQQSSSKRLTEMDEKLLIELKRRGPDAYLTLTEFAASLGQDEVTVRGAMRGAGRSALSVKDELYERFDSSRQGGGGKVRTYRLTPAGREFVKAL
jgi:hypothetical protein